MLHALRLLHSSREPLGHADEDSTSSRPVDAARRPSSVRKALARLSKRLTGGEEDGAQPSLPTLPEDEAYVITCLGCCVADLLSTLPEGVRFDEGCVADSLPTLVEDEPCVLLEAVVLLAPLLTCLLKCSPELLC